MVTASQLTLGCKLRLTTTGATVVVFGWDPSTADHHKIHVVYVRPLDQQGGDPQAVSADYLEPLDNRFTDHMAADPANAPPPVPPPLSGGDLAAPPPSLASARPVISPAHLQAVIDHLSSATVQRLNRQQSREALNSDHEALGWIVEEYHQVVEAVCTAPTSTALDAEVIDLAVACIVALASRKARVDGERQPEGGPNEAMKRRAGE